MRGRAVQGASRTGPPPSTGAGGFREVRAWLSVGVRPSASNGLPAVTSFELSQVGREDSSSAPAPRDQHVGGGGASYGVHRRGAAAARPAGRSHLPERRLALYGLADRLRQQVTR